MMTIHTPIKSNPTVEKLTNNNVATQEKKPMEKLYRCEVIRSKRDDYWNRIRAKNNRILWSSEIYSSKQKALNPIKKFVEHVGVRKCTIKYIDNINKTSEVI